MIAVVQAIRQFCTPHELFAAISDASRRHYPERHRWNEGKHASSRLFDRRMQPTGTSKSDNRSQITVIVVYLTV